MDLLTVLFSNMNYFILGVTIGSLSFASYLVFKRDSINPMFLRKNTPAEIGFFSVFVISALLTVMFIERVLKSPSHSWIYLVDPNVSPITFEYLALIYSHFFSLLGYTVLSIYLAYKWKSIMNSIVITMLCAGAIELLFIPQHLAMFGWILPYTWSWYIPFASMMLPFLSIRSQYITTPKMRLLLFIGTCIVFANIVIPINRWSLTVWSWDAKGFIGNEYFRNRGFTPEVFLFDSVQKIQKIVLTLAFVFYERIFL